MTELLGASVRARGAENPGRVREVASASSPECLPGESRGRAKFTPDALRGGLRGVAGRAEHRAFCPGLKMHRGKQLSKPRTHLEADRARSLRLGRGGQMDLADHVALAADRIEIDLLPLQGHD